MTWLKSALGNADNVVTMEPSDPDAMPKAMALTWREIMARKRVLADMEARRAAEEANFASLSEKHHTSMSRIEQQIADERRKLSADQERVLTMIRSLGIDIQEDEA